MTGSSPLAAIVARPVATCRGYTRPVANAAIVHDLAFINWVVLFALAGGGAGAAVVVRAMSDVAPGYLRFLAAFGAVLGAVVLLADLALPAAATLTVPGDASFDLPRRVLLGAFVVLALAYAVAAGRGLRAPRLGAGLLVVTGLITVAAALGWGGGLVQGVPVVVLFALLLAVTGGTFAAMVLGHWYLVTPALPPRPLIEMTRVLTWLLALQLVIFWLWTALGSGAGGRPFGALVGSSAVFVWLMLGIGLVFPLAVMVMANRTARTRSMESATGLLYIATAAVLAATIVAAGLYFGTGVLA